MLCVEADVALLGGFEVGRDSLGVAAFKYRSQQGGANASALLFWVGAQDRQVVVRLHRMTLFDRAHRAGGAREPRHQRREHRQQHERLARVLAPVPGSGPDRRPGSLRCRVEELLGGQLA